MSKKVVGSWGRCLGRSAPRGVLLAGVLVLAAAAAAGPPELLRYRGLLLDAEGAALSGPVDIEVGIWTGLEGGERVFAESHPSTPLRGGAFELLLGAGEAPSGPFDATVFEGPDRFLEVLVGGEPLLPRQPLLAVAYAFQAGRVDFADDAGRLGGRLPSELQRPLTGSCPEGESIRAIDASGAVTCEVDDESESELVGIVAGTGMTGGGTSGEVTLGLDLAYLQERIGECPPGSWIREIADDGGVLCESDDGGIGDVNGITVSPPLVIGGTVETPTISIGTNSIVSSQIAAFSLGSSEIADDAVGESELQVSSVRGLELADIRAVRVECNGECNDASLGTICNVAGSGWHPIVVTCDAVSNVPGGTSCSADNLCTRYEVNRTMNLGSYCLDGGGGDAIVYCMP